jgi:sugar O-acyltransferase (sialic acid O-acetyltransferase NeuD family)
MAEPLVIYAADRIYAHEVAETLARLDIEIVAGVLTGEPEWDLTGIATLIDAGEVTEALTAYDIVIPVPRPAGHRETVAQAAEAGFSRVRTVIDPEASVSASARLEDGVWVHKGVSIGAGVTVRAHAHINRGALIGHHCVIGAYAMIAPGCVITSHNRIGDLAAIGANATHIPGITVGEAAIVAAGAVVIEDVAAYTMVAGNPARVKKTWGPPAGGKT